MLQFCRFHQKSTLESGKKGVCRCREIGKADDSAKK